MTNNLLFVNKIIQRLRCFGIQTVLFGGWAQEMTKMISPRGHKDIDLLFFSSDFNLLDNFIYINEDIVEIHQKHYPHKRAFLLEGVMIEILLVKQEKKMLVTDYWNEYQLRWPFFKPIKLQINFNQTILIAPTNILQFYSDNYKNINSIREKILKAA